ncbi:MAG: virulence RhuM family protein [Thermoanaerobaculales bacterium]|nr:virulence RhuM family protein [Thermoanaerobaculales bacterium]
MSDSKKRQLRIRNGTAEFLIYRTDDGEVKLDVRLEDESIWLTQQMMAELFQTTKQNIGQHLKNIFDEGELGCDSVVKKFLTTAADAKQYKTNFYNLDAIISVGYRVKSIIATRFRIWATERLKEYIVKGYTMDDERLKNPPVAGSLVPDYFDEMLARIRDIRSSERRMYLRVREIFAMAADYEPSLPETTKFFSIIQNKLHFAATGKTAAEIVHSRANARLPNMGLTSWRRDEVRKTDVTIAKNYLQEKEIEELNRIVTMWLDFAEDQALRRKRVFMKNWGTRLDEFLEFNERRVLGNAGSVSKDDAELSAKEEYEDFAKRRREQKEQLGEADSMKVLEEAVGGIEDGE